jgi:hypothetical protein
LAADGRNARCGNVVGWPSPSLLRTPVNDTTSTRRERIPHGIIIPKITCYKNSFLIRRRVSSKRISQPCKDLVDRSEPNRTGHSSKESVLLDQSAEYSFVDVPFFPISEVVTPYFV